jgi:Ankyrin repeat
LFALRCNFTQYGTDPAVLQVLAAVYPESLTAKEHKGRTPMHLAMVNAHRDDIPNVIKFLLDHPLGRATVNTRDADGYLPLHLLALGLRGYKADHTTKRSNVADCLSMYLDAEPVAAADFFTAIQDLPEWLQDTAVVSKHVRNVLNEKIVRRLPTSILMMDGYMLLTIIVCFGLTTSNHIDIRLGDPANGYTDTTRVELIFLYIGASYFLSRELVQIASLLSLGSFASWLGDPTNWLDVTVIFLVYYFAVLMTDDTLGVSNDSFRNGAAFTQGILYMAVIVYLKSTYVDFAVFVGGVLYVVRRLSAFLLAVGVILLAFAQVRDRQKKTLDRR